MLEWHRGLYNNTQWLSSCFGEGIKCKFNK